MELRYFKTKELGDCYVPEKDFSKIISITKNNIELKTNYEGVIEGVYKALKISDGGWSDLFEASKNRNRENAMGLIRKFHEENNEILEDKSLRISIDPNVPNNQIQFNNLKKSFFNTDPILN